MPADKQPEGEGASPDRAAQVERVLLLIEGGNSERAACAEVGINRQTFRSSVLRVESASQYVRACEALARDQVEKIEDVITDLRDGRITPDVARIELDARKWTASRLFRKTWGDKGSVELTGKDGGPVQLFDLSKASNDDLNRLARLLGAEVDGGAGGEPSRPDNGGDYPAQG